MEKVARFVGFTFGILVYVLAIVGMLALIAFLLRTVF